MSQQQAKLNFDTQNVLIEQANTFFLVKVLSSRETALHSGA